MKGGRSLSQSSSIIIERDGIDFGSRRTITRGAGLADGSFPPSCHDGLRRAVTLNSTLRPRKAVPKVLRLKF